MRDTAAVLDAIAGPMPGDIFVAPAPHGPFCEEVGRDPGRLHVVLLLKDILLDNPVHHECVEAVEHTGQVLESLGHHVDVAHPPQLEGATGLGQALRIVSTSNLAASLDRWSEAIGRPVTLEDVEQDTWERAEVGRGFSAVELQQAVARLLNERFDCLSGGWTAGTCR